MKIALTHKKNINRIYFILETENLSIEEIVKTIGKILLMEEFLDNSSSISCKDFSTILIEHFNFTSDLKEYQYNEIKQIGKIHNLITQYKEYNLSNFRNMKYKEVLKIDIYYLYNNLLKNCHIELKKEIQGDNKYNEIYVEIYKIILKDLERYFKLQKDSLEKKLKFITKI
jgi:hypothetical protein